MAVRVERRDHDHQHADAGRRRPAGRGVPGRASGACTSSVIVDAEQRPRDDGHPREVRRVGALQRLRQDAEAEEPAGEQDERARSCVRRGVVARQAITGTAMAMITTAKNHRNSCCDAFGAGRPHHGGSPSATACRAPSTTPHDGGRGQFAPGAEVEDRVEEHRPRTTLTGPGHDEMHPHRDQADGDADQQRLPGHCRRDDHTANSRARPIARTMSGRNVRASPASTPAIDPVPRCGRSGVARTANTIAHSARATAPCHASADSPIGVRISSAVIHAAPTADDPAPGARQGVDGEDDPEVLEQTEGPFGLERVADDPVPEGERVERARAVEVEEVDVRDLALLHEARGRRA